MLSQAENALRVGECAGEDWAAAVAPGRLMSHNALSVNLGGPVIRWLGAAVSLPGFVDRSV
jgi:hypothetical protein